MGKLPAEGTQARRFGKTRSAQSTALHEDYVELIADLLEGEGEARPTDIARRLGVSHATAIKAIARLKRAGLAIELVSPAPDGLSDQCRTGGAGVYPFGPFWLVDTTIPNLDDDVVPSGEADDEEP